jgi:hypothetical protein
VLSSPRCLRRDRLGRASREPESAESTDGQAGDEGNEDEVAASVAHCEADGAVHEWTDEGAHKRAAYATSNKRSKEACDGSRENAGQDVEPGNLAEMEIIGIEVGRPTEDREDSYKQR